MSDATMAASGNLLLEPVEYKIEETAGGVRRSYMYPSGALFTEYRSHLTVNGWPLVHTTRGICPETGHRVMARGVIAIGRVAVGVVAIGQWTAGLLAIGQFSAGLLMGIGQFTAGTVALGQFALGLGFGLGQFATGLYAIGQFAGGAETIGQLTYPPKP